ncbi:putative WD40 repeats [Lyophyllum shimeji]|uniref:ASTRA-associated protein 1 n=1 Tax=Lyophyllum shimeji TaxID=47721 RepID=A0A9P3PRY6_LYOSH|nr:putative WD40 repeats [Lyophyllum shimeji]
MMAAPLAPAAPTHLLRTHSSPIHALSISPDNERLYSGDASGLVVVTSTRSLRPITSWNPHTDALLGIEEWRERIITHARDNKLHVWTRVEELPPSARLGGGSAAQMSTPRPKLRYSMDVNALNYCRFSLLPLPAAADEDDAQAEALIALPNLVDSTSADIWALPSRERVHAAVGQTGVKMPFNVDPMERSKTGIIMSLHLYAVPRERDAVLSSSSSVSAGTRELRLLCGYESGGVTLRRFARTDRVTSLEGAGWEVIWDAKLHAESIMAMRVSRKNDFALSVSADHIVVRYDLADPNVAAACVTHRTKHPGNAALAIRDDGRVCAVAGWDGSVRLYAARTMKHLGTLKYHKSACQAVEFAHALRVEKVEAGIRGSDFKAGAADEEQEEDEESEDEMSWEEKEERARWLVAGGKDSRVSIWSLISFEKE